MLIASLQAMLQRISGLDLATATVAHAAHARMRARAIGDMEAYVRQTEDDPAECTALLELLVVPETWLFRDPEAFAAAASFARSRYALSGRPVRILSLPCATGEEPYSLAMALLDEGMPPSAFTIDAIDISAAALMRARAGVFRPNAFRGEDRGFRRRYFRTVDGGELLQHEVRALVRFSQGNLLAMETRHLIQQFDIVFCRNLIIYFDQPTQHRAVAILHQLLDDDGLLFAGYAELPVFAGCGFETARLSRAFALRKVLARTTAAAARFSLDDPCPSTAPARPQVAVRAASAPVAVPAMARGQPYAVMPATCQPAVSAAANVNAMLDGARLLADQGLLAPAALELERHLALAPDSAPAYAMLGAIRASQHDMQAAETCLRRALYLDPNQYQVLCQLALLAEGHGNASGAANLRARAARVLARQDESAGATPRDGASKGRP